MNIVLIGIQGSGKGTLVANLEKSMKFDLISVGQLLRDEAATGSELGKHIRELQTKGILVELETVLNTINKKLKTSKSKNYVFDGFPRNLNQAKAMNEICKVDLVVCLNLTKEIAMERLLNRLTCTKCGNIFNKKQVKSKVCPYCKGKFEQRSDDTVNGINKRFERYYEETYPLIDYYKKQNLLVEVDASLKPYEVADLVMRAINEHNYKK